MGMSGHFKRISARELDAVTADHHLVEDLVFPADDEQGSGIDIDKSWQGLHFLLTGEAFGGSGPLAQAVLGGIPIGEDLTGYGPTRYLTVDQVSETSAALDGLSESELATRFDPEAMRLHGIYPGVWMDGEHDLAYLLGGFRTARDYYAAAAISGDAMLMYIA